MGEYLLQGHLLPWMLNTRIAVEISRGHLGRRYWYTLCGVHQDLIVLCHCVFDIVRCMLEVPMQHLWGWEVRLVLRCRHDTRGGIVNGVLHHQVGMGPSLSVTRGILGQLLSDVLIVFEGHLKLLLSDWFLLLEETLPLAGLIMLIRGRRWGIGAHLAEIMPGQALLVLFEFNRA